LSGASLIQSFIASASSVNSNNIGDGTLRAADLEALRQYNKKKNNIKVGFYISIYCEKFCWLISLVSGIFFFTGRLKGRRAKAEKFVIIPMQSCKISCFLSQLLLKETEE
jgi:hypothetical protein